MTEGSGGSPPYDVDALDSRPAAGRVFSLDGGGLAPATDADDLTRASAPPVPAALAPEGAPMAERSATPLASAPVGWDEISPDRLRESAANQEARGVFGETETAAPIGMAWYEVVLGCLLGLAATLGMYEWSVGGLGPFVVVPSIVLGLVLLAIPRHDIRHVGFGLLVSVPAVALLGLGLWYAAEWF